VSSFELTCSSTSDDKLQQQFISHTRLSANTYKESSHSMEVRINFEEAMSKSV